MRGGRRWWGGWLLLLLLLAGCQASAPPPEPEGPTVGDIPLLGDAQPLDVGSLPISLKVAGQVYGEVVDDELVAYFRVSEDFLDLTAQYDSEMKRLGWQLIDSLQFGDGGNVRRYHRGQQRAILALEPEGEETRFMLMQGQVR